MIDLIITSSVLILVVIAIRYALRGKISLRLQYALWLVVLVRLLMPVSIGESRISLMNMVEKSATYGLAEQTLSEMQIYSDIIRGSELSVDEAEKVGAGTLHEIQGYSAETDGGYKYNYIFTDSLGTVLSRILRPLWLVGIALVGLCLVISNLIFTKKVRRARKRIHVADIKLPVYVVDGLPTPCLFGLFFPSIYISPDVAQDETKLRHVLAHEETHYHHKDHIWSALRVVCLVVHWYNPLVWLAAMLSRRDGELACDEGTIIVIGEEDRIEYGRTLIGLTCERRNPLDLLSTATTMTDGIRGIRERITLIAKKPKMLISALIAVLLVVAVVVGCTFTGADNEIEEPESGIIQLTEDEIEQANKALGPFLFDEDGNNIGVNPLSHFFKCFYDTPEDINLAEFLRYLPSEIVTDETEFKAVKEHKNFYFGEDATLDRMPVPVHRITAESVSEMLVKYTGITLDNLSGVGAEDILYLEEYDSYYNFTSDFGAGTFQCTHGEREGDVVRLFDSDRIQLTLQKQGDDYLIVSFQRLGPEETDNANNSNGSDAKGADLEDIRTIGQVSTIYTHEENMGHTGTVKVAELLMTQLLDDLKFEQDGRTFIITDWENLSVSADRMYDAWVVTGDVDIRYGGIFSPIGDSKDISGEEYFNVSIGERYLRHENGVYTLSLAAGDQQAVLEAPLLNRDMNVGIGVIGDYVDDERLIFHGYFGLFVYDLKTEKIVFSADLKKAVGTTVVQGSEGAAVCVSADGSTIQLYFYPERGEPIMAYTIDTNTYNYKYDYYAPLDAFVFQTDEMYDRFSSGSLEELTYTDGNTTWLIFEDWPWAE